MKDNGAMSYTESAEVPKEGSEPIKLTDKEAYNYSKEEIKVLSKSLAQGFKQCKKEKKLDECSFGYETGVLITGNDAKYILELMTSEKALREQLKEERNKAIDACLEQVQKYFDKADLDSPRLLDEMITALKADSK